MSSIAAMSAIMCDRITANREAAVRRKALKAKGFSAEAISRVEASREAAINRKRARLVEQASVGTLTFDAGPALTLQQVERIRANRCTALLLLFTLRKL